MTTRSVVPVELGCPSRRGVLRALAGVGATTVAAGVLTACGGADDGAPGTDGPARGAAGGAAGAAEEAAGAASGTVSVPLADVPVGEAVVVDVDGTRYVVARPSEGDVVAFSAACTHAGTAVEAVGGTELRCPAHGSRFDAGEGGAVLGGPADAPLPSVPAGIEGDLVVLSV